MARIAIFGGTFNPIHNGHLHLAKTVFEMLALDRLILVPSCLPPHKQAEQLIAPSHRLKMCELAVEESLGYAVSDIEIARGGRSFTYQTVVQFAAMYPNDTLFLIMGSDMLFTLNQWKNPQEIYRHCTVCAIARSNGEKQRLEQKKQELERSGAKILLFHVPPLDISSTQVRADIRMGKPIGQLVPDAVARYIEVHSLYEV